MAKRKQVEEIQQKLLRTHPKEIGSKLSDITVRTNQPNRPKMILSHLFWELAQAIGMNLVIWDAKMKRYVFNPRNGIKQTPDARTTERGNLTGQLLNPNMTWLSFFKGLRFLEFVEIEISVKGKLRDGRVVGASVSSSTDIIEQAVDANNSQKTEGEAQ